MSDSPLASGVDESLRRFEELLRDHAVPLGLVAEGDATRLYERHLLDSLRAAKAFGPEDRFAVDIGSGAGLPGIVLACALPDRSFRLVERKRRAAAFLELAVDRLGLSNVDVVIRRAEEVHLQADVATARAFAPLERTWATAVPLLRPGGRLLYFVGERLSDPAGAARGIHRPEPPAAVDLLRGIDSFTPIVIMARRG
jgi:16S rRNA (guanine527-N7)-methyltransferase